MRNLCSAWRFVQGLRAPVGPTPVAWTGPAGLEGVIVRPASRPSRGVLVAVHGMSPRAETDVRWTRALSALGAAGFTVVSPHFRSIAALHIGPEQIDEIALAAVAIDADVAERRGVSLFAVSFSAGLSAAAAARPVARGVVRAVCAIGGWARLRSLLPTVLGDSLPDPYARFVILENFIEAALGRPLPRVREALRGAAVANFHEVPFDLDGAVRQAVEASEVDRALAVEIVALARGLGDTERFTRQLCANEPGLFPAIEPLGQLDGLEASVTLVHGESDPVIPPEQSRALATRLEDHAATVRLCVTPLIGHGDTRLPLRALVGNGPRLLGAFGGFFRAAATA
jgi:pimeloyl-ACP methyl ester carboxylesterase